jgi:hypothetical protein
MATYHDDDTGENPAMTPLATRDEVLEAGEAFERSCKALAGSMSLEKLAAKAAEFGRKERTHLANAWAAARDKGRYYEAMKIKSPGTYLEVLEKQGVGRTQVQFYRDVAKYFTLLRAIPGFADMSYNAAKPLISSLKAAGRDGEDLDGEDLDAGSAASTRPMKGRQPKALRARGQRSVFKREGERMLAHVRENRGIDPDLPEEVEDFIERLRRAMSKAPPAVIDPEPNDSTGEFGTEDA